MGDITLNSARIQVPLYDKMSGILMDSWSRTDTIHHLCQTNGTIMHAVDAW